MSVTRTAWRAKYVKDLPKHVREPREGGVGPGWVRIEGRGLETSLLLKVGYADNGETICTGLAMGLLEDPPVRVTASALRLPLQEMLAAVDRQTGWPLFIAGGGLEAITPGIRRVRPGAKGYSDQDLRDLVREYRRARKETPSAPTKTLAEKKVLSEQAIRYQLRLAERRKLLKRDERKRTRGGRR